MKFRIEKLNKKFDETLCCNSIEQIKNDKKNFQNCLNKRFKTILIKINFVTICFI